MSENFSKQDASASNYNKKKYKSSKGLIFVDCARKNTSHDEKRTENIIRKGGFSNFLCINRTK